MSPGRGHGNPLWCSCLENPHGQRSLEGYCPCGRKESDTTEWLSTYTHAKHLKVILDSSLPLIVDLAALVCLQSIISIGSLLITPTAVSLTQAPLSFKFIYLFIFGCARSSVLHMGFPHCSKQGLLFSCGAQASQCGGCSVLQVMGSRVCTLGSCGTRA